MVYFGSGFQIFGFVSFSRSFQFSFLPLVKVLVNYRFRLFGESFRQVSFNRLHFFGAGFGKLLFQFVSESLNQFRFGWSKWAFG